MVQMVKICIAKIQQITCGTENLWDSHGPNGQDLQTKNPTDNLWDSHGPNGQDVQSKIETKNLWDSHGQYGQDFPSVKMCGMV